MGVASISPTVCFKTASSQSRLFLCELSILPPVPKHCPKIRLRPIIALDSPQSGIIVFLWEATNPPEKGKPFSPPFGDRLPRRSSFFERSHNFSKANFR